MIWYYLAILFLLTVTSVTMYRYFRILLMYRELQLRKIKETFIDSYDLNNIVTFDYVNYRGKPSNRRVAINTNNPLECKSTIHHPNVCWMINGLCLDRNAPRTFPLKDIKNFREE